jgi:hypothetical protein
MEPTELSGARTRPPRGACRHGSYCRVVFKQASACRRRMTLTGPLSGRRRRHLESHSRSGATANPARIGIRARSTSRVTAVSHDEPIGALTASSRLRSSRS